MSAAPTDRAGFVARFGGVFEHSPWIAETAFDRYGFDPDETAADVHRHMVAVLDDAKETAHLALIRAHPDLAGKLARAGELTEASRREQAGAGLDACSDEEFTRLTALNDAYKERFGFPFILAVKGRTRHDIIAAFERRLHNDRAAEIATAIAEIKKIALFRLQDMLP